MTYQSPQWVKADEGDAPVGISILLRSTVHETRLR